MCVCAYSSLFKVKIFDIYELVPQHHSDEGSLLFIGAYLCRLTFPICYNFLNMVGDDENSIFAKYQGKNVNLAPLLGQNYNKWLPMVILVFCIVTLLNIHGRIMRLFKLKNYFYESISANDADTEDGRQIIDQARKIEERRLARDPFLNYNSLGLGVTSERSYVRGTGASTVKGQSTTEEFLARYKRGEISGTRGGALDPDRETLLGGNFSGSRASDESDGHDGRRKSLEQSDRGNVFSKLGAYGSRQAQTALNSPPDDTNLHNHVRKFGLTSTSPQLQLSPATQRSTLPISGSSLAPQTFKMGAFASASSTSSTPEGGKKPKAPPGNLFSDL
ncbi:LMBR1 domain-containing protein 2 [Nowakowskiella sp. JEL0078]|nr:LMBR1 domain-containing protein 2 [Nowakowskiella sp. JEL0078]